LGVPYFLSEASHGRYITKVGIVPHSGTTKGGSSFSNVVFHFLKYKLQIKDSLTRRFISYSPSLPSS
jgi:hypothetical protein